MCSEGSGVAGKGSARKGEVVLTDDFVDNLKREGYFIKEKIGVGSYATVFLAQSTKHQKDIALKVMDVTKLGQHFADKFLTGEVNTVKALKTHPHIVEFYDIFQNNQFYSIIMEYCPNGDLYEYISKRRFVPEPQSCAWFKQLIDGVAHCHQHGFAHRDLKCENVLLDSQYNIKITDFGFACKIETRKSGPRQFPALSSLDSEGLCSTFCGSVLYACPELLRSQPYHPTKSGNSTHFKINLICDFVDIWSCGIIVWVMIFGSYPFDEEKLKSATEGQMFSYNFPENPIVSVEFKKLLQNVLVDEGHRWTIEQIKESEWCKKAWKEEGEVKKDTKYYEHLGIIRQGTTEFLVDDISHTQNISAVVQTESPMPRKLELKNLPKDSSKGG